VNGCLFWGGHFTFIKNNSLKVCLLQNNDYICTTQLKTTIMKASTQMTISKEQLLKIDRAARRLADIELGIANFKHKAHKTAKDYNRKESKKIVWE
jgi:hypothetical protein